MIKEKEPIDIKFTEQKNPENYEIDINFKRSNV